MNKQKLITQNSSFPHERILEVVCLSQWSYVPGFPSVGLEGQDL